MVSPFSGIGTLSRAGSGYQLMRYLSKTFTLPASPRITQAAWDAIWNPPKKYTSRGPSARCICGVLLWVDPMHDTTLCKPAVCERDAGLRKEEKVASTRVLPPERITPPEPHDELPPQDLPLDPSTPVRIGLPRGCF